MDMRSTQRSTRCSSPAPAKCSTSACGGIGEGGEGELQGNTVKQNRKCGRMVVHVCQSPQQGGACVCHPSKGACTGARPSLALHPAQQFDQKTSKPWSHVACTHTIHTRTHLQGASPA
jgi:hypothetical protein